MAGACAYLLPEKANEAGQFLGGKLGELWNLPSQHSLERQFGVMPDPKFGPVMIIGGDDDAWGWKSQVVKSVKGIGLLPTRSPTMLSTNPSGNRMVGERAKIDTALRIHPAATWEASQEPQKHGLVLREGDSVYLDDQHDSLLSQSNNCCLGKERQ